MRWGAVQRLGAGTFPVGTLLVNVTGSFLIGAVIYRGDRPKEGHS